MRYIEYKPDTGEITGYYDVPEEIAEIMKNNGQHIIRSDTAFYETHYIETSSLTVKERPTQNTVIDCTECKPYQIVTLSGLPKPCVVRVTIPELGAETEYNVTDGVLEWDTDLAGIYKFTVEAFPYKPFEREVKIIEGEA